MTSLARWVSRVYPRLTLALVVVTSLFAYGFSSSTARSRRPSAFVRAGGAEPPRIRQAGGVSYVASPTAPERIVPDTLAPDGESSTRLLWLAGRLASPTTGGSIVLDAGGGVVEFDEALRPQRRPVAAEGRSITGVVPATNGGLWLADDAGRLLHADKRGHVIGEFATPFRYAALAADARGTQLWTVRSPERFGYGWDSTGGALIARVTGGGVVDKRLGRATLPAHVMLQDLANGGRVAVGNNRIYYAPFIRDEIIALDTLGDTLWVASRDLPQTTREPSFEIDSGHVVVNYHAVNLGVNLGPDGRLYVLSTPGFTTTRSRLDAFDPETGHLLRSAQLSTALPTIGVDSEGRVYLLDATRLLTGVTPREREAFPRIVLATRAGDTVTTASFRGRVTLLNFWASWCTVCRAEMPALDSIHRAYSDSGVAFVSINADQSRASADRFLRNLGLHFDYALGDSHISATHHVPGLPYTILLDREGRVVQRWAGFTGAEQSDVIRAAVRLELQAGKPPSDQHTHHHANH